jgi:predicted HTH domain antitoxin
MLLAEELDKLAEYEHSSRIDLARQILWEGVARRKQERALALYAEGKVTKSKAAEIAGISLWEMMEIVRERRIPSGYTLTEALNEVRRLLGQEGRQLMSGTGRDAPL